MRHDCTTLKTLAFFGAWFCFSATAALAAKPNVIVILADDLGIGDIQPTNPSCKIATPNLSRMAREGMTFLDAHTPSSVCTPTRYGLLTGRYNWRSRLAKGVLGGASPHLIPANRPTLGHLMQKAGYQTAMIGKWHLGWDWAKQGQEIDFTQHVKNGPDINGFHMYYGFSGSLDMPPYVWVHDGKVTALPNRIAGVTEQENRYGWYRKGPIGADFDIAQALPHVIDKAISYVKAQAATAKNGQPFFLYLALPAPHTPIVPIAPFKDASRLNVYADFVMQVDHHLGQILTTLKETGMEQETLVIFTSDNGCSPQANFELLQEKGHFPSGQYRGHKADIFEGGHRVPLIARWPALIPANKTTSALACLTDIYATLEAIIGQTTQSIGGEDSFNLLPVLKGESRAQRETLVSHSIDGSFAIRQGPWKLCLCAGSGGWSAPLESDARKQNLPMMQLYHLEDDPAEKENLAAEHPNQVQQLLTILADQVTRGRSTPGEPLQNDRSITYK
jgi:arylsulfatase A